MLVSSSCAWGTCLPRNPSKMGCSAGQPGFSPFPCFVHVIRGLTSEREKDAGEQEGDRSMVRLYFLYVVDSELTVHIDLTLSISRSFSSPNSAVIVRVEDLIISRLVSRHSLFAGPLHLFRITPPLTSLPIPFHAHYL